MVYTKEAETADQYIEKTVHHIGRKYNVVVATSDALEQLIIWGQGATRMSALGLKEEMERIISFQQQNFQDSNESGRYFPFQEKDIPIIENQES